MSLTDEEREFIDRLPCFCTDEIICDGHTVKAIVNSLSARVERLEGALEEIVETCGVVNFSSFNQVKEAVGISLDIAQEALKKEVKP